MSATDELRRLLDERGADYRMRQSVTSGSMIYYDRYTVLVDGNPHALIDTGNDDDVVLTLRCTPEQAIAATLGSDREAELEALVKDLYENAVDFNFKGWIPYYRGRFAALGIEVE